VISHSFAFRASRRLKLSYKSIENACTALPSTLVSMLELSPPLPILLLLRVGGLSRLNTRAVRYEDVWGSFFFLSSVLVILMLLPLYPRYPLDMRQGVPQSRSEPYRDSNSDPSVVQPVVSGCTDCATAALVMEIFLNLTLKLRSPRLRHRVKL
jgi:hypothetical protein